MIINEEEVLVIASRDADFVLLTKRGVALHVYTDATEVVDHFNDKMFRGFCAGLTTAGYICKEVDKKWGEMDDKDKKAIKSYIPATQESVLTIS